MGAWAASRKSTYLQIRQYGQLWAESLLSQHSLTLYYVAKLRWAMVQLLIRSSCVCLSRPVIRTLRPVRRIYLRANGEWSAFCANLPRDQVAFPVNRTRPLLLESETFSLSRSSGDWATHVHAPYARSGVSKGVPVCRTAQRAVRGGAPRPPACALLAARYTTRCMMIIKKELRGACLLVPYPVLIPREWHRYGSCAFHHVFHTM